jgi:hypothetical protein
MLGCMFVSFVYTSVVLDARILMTFGKVLEEEFPPLLVANLVLIRSTENCSSRLQDLLYIVDNNSYEVHAW